MATRFNPKEYAKNRLTAVCARYFPKDHIRINIGRKGFRLGDNMNIMIDKSKTIIDSFQNSKEIIPESTVNVYRYGTVLQDIFQNLSDYQMVSQVKSRSRRGYRKELEVLDFDTKKIELEFKKSGTPPVKSLKDDKLIKNDQKLYLKLFQEAKIQKIIKDVIKKQNLFVIDDSEGKKYYDTLFRLLNSFHSLQQKKMDQELQLKQLDLDIRELENNLVELKRKLPEVKQQIELHRLQNGIPGILQEKEQLFTDPELSLFLKVLTTCLERYIKMMERRESQSLEQKEEFSGLVLEPSKFKGLNESLWRQIVFIIETHGLELLSGKSWFRFENPTELRDFIVQKDNLEKYARLRNLENQLEEIERKMYKDPTYMKLQDNVHEFAEKEKLFNKFRNTVEEVTESVIMLSQELEIEKNKVLTYLTQN